VPNFPPATSLSPRRARARYRAWHRGTREMDLILGPFADAEIAVIGEAELEEFERLMDVPDWDLFHWITGEKPVPQGFDTVLFRRIVEGRSG
jgi:antitoxin CptB